ncbi:MAG: D-alanyl-D-alanine carboxypeptidase [Candidatus Magasanikbacteria bacterium]|jgi:serine-type D-Ala-D-Ala endopeptidase (penicillin-binding protein 7)|nr:D-alanyl-D-alanine carboxypeptidase [Candidatus Magasanikbacteria bacterium]MBT4314909.1 D-alanyl-D-alanine carboxypeptidase [Candidatus Magasanikbacteria bacterium]MBT4546865.1 D-alanyl-D-alanine carboxypeptidase [Candidatus Magasanikbacteria bacterium]MBT6819221.1 D-alanyl-D-alanine carboxypeptidase [Candidatus Magasanikbacteria bacterium]
MKLYLKIASFVILASIVLLPSFVLSEDQFDASYIISDEEMQNWESMSRAGIQAFLDDYDSYLANFKTSDKDGVTRMTSDIIARSAKEHSINPKYLLVKLQKEQSLITTNKPTQKQLDGATGYGITDGCGWSCETYKNNKGFGKQVDSAAGIIRWYYENVKLQPWIKKANQTSIIDGQAVVPKNYATAFLYTYTPHIEGNKNFWTLWNRWFGQVYPDGTLVKNSSGSETYLIQDGKKKLIKSMSVLASRFDPKMIITAPMSELSNYEDSEEISFPNYSILKQGNKYYLLDYETLRPFASYNVVKNIGYNPDEIVTVSASDISNFKIGLTISIDTEISSATGRLLRIKENNSLYYLKDGVFNSISDEDMAHTNFPDISEEKVAVIELHKYKSGDSLKFRDGTIVGIKGFNKIYVIEKGKKRHIASEEVFNGFGYDWDNIVWTDVLTGTIHPTGQPIYLPSRLAIAMTNDNDSDQTKNTDDTTITIEENGKMYSISENDTKYVGKKFTTNVNTYLVADYATQEILSGKNIDVTRPLASFTKVMTAYRLMSEGLSPSQSSTYNPTEHKSAYHRFRIASGEKYRNSDLLKAMLVSSLNTPARILVDSVEEDEASFISSMNKQAKDWGLGETNFTDVYGYDLGNISTAREFLTLYSKAEKNKTVRENLGMKSYQYNELKDKDGKSSHHDNHSNKLVNKAGLNFNIISSKTGYLNEAGSGLIMLIERKTDNKKFVVITMGNPDYTNRFDEPERLSEWSIDNF